MLWLAAAPVFAADITVSGACSLLEAIENANTNTRTNDDCEAGDSDGVDTIILSGNVTANDAYRIRDDLTIDGKGKTIRNVSFDVVSSATNLTFKNVTLVGNDAV